MPRARVCRPPATTNVKGHWRQVRKTRRKKRTARKAPAGGYWVVANPQGRTCGHHHRTLRAAVACSRRKDRAERNYRARQGLRMPRGGVWIAERRK